MSDQGALTPLAMHHGTGDQVVKYKWAEESFARLKSLHKGPSSTASGAGDNCTFTTYRGMGHTVSEEELGNIGEWLRRALPQDYEGKCHAM